MPVSIWTKKQKEEREEKAVRGREGGSPGKTEAFLWQGTDWTISGRLGVLRILPTDSSQVSLCVLVHPVPPTGCPPPSFFCLFSPWFSQWAAEGSPSNPSNFPLPAFLQNVISAQRIPSIHCPGCHEHMALHNLNSIPFQPQEKYGLGMSMFLLNG